jgi:Leucine-rich repeat (LRR) protein
MRDVGDMSKLYWTEFNIEGEAPKLIRLQLGYDGISSTDPNVENGKWYNKKINAINLKAAMPLLKEANFSNLTILSNNLTIDLTKSPKLENFRAVGSNIQAVYFAEGAALNTVYVPKSLVTLTLDNTNLLKNLITTSIAPIPEKGDGDTLIAEKGLYIDGLFGSTERLNLSYIRMKSVPFGY